ncbi:UPF0473 protein [Lactiplantibacillus plantarum subsp. plantarum]|uniref:UPF0473 protein n=1 Tax=Lactiplantibacillus plantarum subsp. plantarum TaxID=337330 RepID=A0A2S3U4C4_LACPN|nr:UPF0473 protein [Lactiplantibacillus plantarum subsp. plantarum]
MSQNQDRKDNDVITLVDDEGNETLFTICSRLIQKISVTPIFYYIQLMLRPMMKLIFKPTSLILKMATMANYN